ncbi:hypothetical protein KSP40_PGU011156 [Platanthera guangdongensis]|uniref:Oxidoreductase-like domain-containing protein n=1 Tax=Platanthera guangdongensis TaxID=2320717 RepID=A0ABR2M0B1_9ASPA
MEPLLNNGSNELNRSEETVESSTPQEAEYPSSSPDLPPLASKKPDPGDCCGSGSVPCIWDLYYEELKAYTKSLEACNMRVSSKQNREHS